MDDVARAEKPERPSVRFEFLDQLGTGAAHRQAAFEEQADFFRQAR